MISLVLRNLAKFGDLAGAKIIRKRVFAKFLDDVNFLPASNPYGTADPDAGFPDECYYINRKTAENKSLVEFELATSLELDNIKIPNRVGLCRFCYWSYRGYGCHYKGPPKTTTLGANFNIGNNSLTSKGLWEESKSYSVGDYVYTSNDSYLIRDEEETNVVDGESNQGLRTYYVCISAHTSSTDDHPEISSKWQKDECQKTVQACNLRFEGNLPFGGFPATYEYNSQI